MLLRAKVLGLPHGKRFRILFGTTEVKSTAESLEISFGILIMIITRQGLQPHQQVEEPNLLMRTGQNTKQ